MARSLRRRREADGNASPPIGKNADLIGLQVTDKSEIPCRVSSDLHEWRNDLATVSTRDPAKLQYE